MKCSYRSAETCIGISRSADYDCTLNQPLSFADIKYRSGVSCWTYWLDDTGWSAVPICAACPSSEKNTFSGNFWTTALVDFRTDETRQFLTYWRQGQDSDKHCDVKSSDAFTHFFLLSLIYSASSHPARSQSIFITPRHSSVPTSTGASTLTITPTRHQRSQLDYGFLFQRRSR